MGTRICWRGAAAVLLAAGMTVSSSGAVAAGAASGTEVGSRTATTAGTVRPERPVSADQLPPADPAGQAERYQRLLERRERTTGALRSLPEAATEANTPAPNGPTVAEPVSDALLVRKNVRNTVATSVSSTLAEPAAAADSTEVFYAGNTYQSYSSNAGLNWSNLGSYPAGPADAPLVCCDADAVHHSSTDTTFNSILYTNSAQTNGVVRIFVRRGAASAVDCSYTIDPAGSANNILPDYPHIAVSNNYLYLTTNNLGSSWQGAQVRRFNISQLSSCLSASFNTFTYTGSVGQRVFTPAEGAKTTMVWGSMDNATTFRMFRWDESTTSVTQFTRTVTASAFNNPDCRGGTGNFDFIERSTAWSIAGFRMRAAITGSSAVWLWPSSPTGGRTQAHLRGVAINLSTNAVSANPVVFNDSFCMGYPVLGGNAFGDLGLSFATGGRAGGGGTAAQGAVAVDDASSTGIFFPVFSTTALGTHNRSDGRFGDYFTVRANERCPNTWVATNSALLNGNTSSSHVNARFVEFQSNLLVACPA